VRIDDIDPPREVPGTSAAILGTLERYGLEWDGAVLYQGERGPAYDEALAVLDTAGQTYRCSCTRREIATTADRGPGGPIYPGHCRAGPRRSECPTVLRLRVPDTEVAFTDGLFGHRSMHLGTELGDFVLRRADGLYAYHLAVVVDDAAQGVTEVIRGADLLELSAPQIHLQRELGLVTPGYLHLPLVLDRHGDKLSKQTGARPLPDDDPRPVLLQALRHLGQAPPAALRSVRLEELWRWALDHWNPAHLSPTPNPSPGEHSTTS